MYCSTCGNRIADHLNYCNSCGARIEKNPLIVSNSSSAHLGKAVGAVGAIGLFAFIGVLKIVLENNGLDIAAKVVIILAYLGTLFMICAMMIGHMWKHSGDIRVKQHEPKPQSDYGSPPSFRGVNTAQLEEARESGISVTEHTTRTLDEVPLNRN
jgi:hypothetical protein